MAKAGTPKIAATWKSLQLWPHQVEAVSVVRRYQDSGSSGSALVRMPPGSGKTGIMAVLAQAFDDTADVLVVAPWAQLTHQIAKEIGGAFWGKLGAQPRKQLRPTVTFRPSHLAGLLKAQAKEPTVFVCTNQTLERLSATNKNAYRSLAQRIALVLVDEGHREPAPEWAKAVRGLERPTVLFTATPYRNDQRLFNVDPGFVYRFSVAQALAGRFIRRVAFDEVDFGDSPKSFVERLLTFYSGSFLKSKPAGPSAIRVIVRCATDVDVKAVSALLRKQKQRVVAVHENFERNSDEQTFRRVPDPGENDAVFWVHQFKLVEGVDDPDFGLLAIYQPLANARALVQQVGRVIRNPTQSPGRVAHVFCHPRQKQKRMWDAYLRYEDQLGKGAKEVGPPEVVRDLVRLQDEYAYLDGNFRQPFDPSAPDFFRHIRYPLAANVFTVRPTFRRKDLAVSIREMLAKADCVLTGEASPDRQTDVFVYARCSVSPLLSDQTFMDFSLAFAIVTQADGYLFYYDSQGQSPEYLSEHAERVETDELERLFAGERVRVSGISLLNTDLGLYSVRRRSMTAPSIERLAPGLGDHAHFCSTASGIVRAGKGERIRRYVGFTRSRITEHSSSPVDYDDYVAWVSEIAETLHRASSTITPLFERYALNVRTPKAPIPAHILLDLDDIEEEFALVEASEGPSEGIIVDDSCSDVTAGTFTCVIGGKPCVGSVRFDVDKRRFQIDSTDMGGFAIRYGPGHTERRDLVGYLNLKQAFRIICEDGLVYAHGRFYKSRFPLWGRKQSARINLVDILLSHPDLSQVTSEKGGAVQAGGTGWETGSIFELIDRRGVTGLLASQGFNPDVLICDDLGPELADFIAVRLDPPRIAMIHAKHGRDASTLSASAFHDVCGQAAKNLGALTPQWEGPPKDVSRWNHGWSVSAIGTVTRRIRVNTTTKAAADLWVEIQRLVRQPTAVREVWIVMGNGMSRASFDEARKKDKPPASVIQLFYLLQSTWSAVSSIGALFRVFSRP